MSTRTAILGTIDAGLAPSGSLIRIYQIQVWTNGAYATPGVSPTAAVSIANPDGTAVANATNLSMTADAGHTDALSLVMPANAVLVNENVYVVTVTVTSGGVSEVFQTKSRAVYPSGSSVA